MANQEEMINSDGVEVGIVHETRAESVDNMSAALKKKLTIAIGVLAIIVIGVVAVVLYNNSQQEKEQGASAALSRVRPIFESGEYAKALDGDAKKLIRDTPVLGLKEIVEQYGSTENGKVAALYAGNAHLSLKKFAEAEGYFEKALSSSSSEVVVGATTGLAICKEIKNDYLGAGELYEKSVLQTSQTGMKDKYRLYAALSYEKAHNNERAEKLFREILHGETMEYVSESKSGLTRLGMIVE